MVDHSSHQRTWPIVLHNSNFRDAIHLKYNWQPNHVHVRTCICGKSCTVDDALRLVFILKAHQHADTTRSETVLQISCRKYATMSPANPDCSLSLEKHSP